MDKHQNSYLVIIPIFLQLANFFAILVDIFKRKDRLIPRKATGTPMIDATFGGLLSQAQAVCTNADSRKSFAELTGEEYESAKESIIEKAKDEHRQPLN